MMQRTASFLWFLWSFQCCKLIYGLQCQDSAV